jgi:hypothetical protein
MNGQQLVKLLVQHQLGVSRVQHDGLELQLDPFEARQPKIPLTGPFDPPAEPCIEQWDFHSAYGEWWCWTTDYAKVVDRVVNQPYREMLEDALSVTTREECEARFPRLFWYGEREVGPPGTCRGHQ